MRSFVILIFLVLPVVAIAQEYARILDHSTTYTVYENEMADMDEFLKIEILSERGLGFSIYQEYFDRFRKISDVTIDVIDASGKRIKRLRRGDGREFGLSPVNEITDGTALIIDPEYKQYPFVLEISTKIKLDGFVTLPTWVPRAQFHLAVNKSRLTIIRPSSVKINFREENIEGSTKISGNESITTYEVSNLGSIENKMRYEDFFKEQPKVYACPESFRLDKTTGSNASWIEFGDWYYSLNDSPYKLSEKTSDFIKGLDKRDRIKLIQDIYEYMQDRTRYVSIQLGVGGFKSLPTEDVENYGYGDCKALTTYMKNMLDYAGIKSHYVLAKAGKDVPDVIADFPSSQFNHVFLGIPSVPDTFYLECTSQISPTNYTGNFTDDRNVLWIEKGKSSIVRSRTYDHSVNRQAVIGRIKLDKEGNANAEFDITNQGVFFEEFMMFKLAPSDDVKQYNQDKFEYDDFDLNDFSLNQPHRSVPSFDSRYSLTIRGLAKVVNDKLILPIVLTAPIDSRVEKDNLRMYYSIKRGFSISDAIEVDIPQNYWIYNLPGVEQIQTAYGNYLLKVEFDGQKLIVKRQVILYKGDYTSNSGYEGFKTFFQAIERLEKRKLVLLSKT